ncbi:hypothetical protein HAX54_029568, partial [Datura stramonium]|nr:hypothetical protein [Datura stramonium]
MTPFKDDFPDIYNQIGIRDWGPFTILMLGSCFLSWYGSSMPPIWQGKASSSIEAEPEVQSQKKGVEDKEN